MADDGMLLNFDVSSVPLTTQVKFKGGRWRDRNRAQRSIKRQQQGQVDERAAPGGDKDRPLKRRRVEETSARLNKRSSDASSKPDGHSHQHWQPSASNPAPTTTTGRPQNGVTSRLFTSNPTPLTDFKAETTAADADDDSVKPSNAPLSDEAATFHALGLSRRIAQHLSTKLDMKAPTAIQKNAIPKLVGEDSDAFLQAETGSGKTLAYLLPLVQRIVALSEKDDGTKRGKNLHRNSGLFAIILAPTRELCKQISVVLERLLRCAPWIVSTTVIGGESKKSEKARIRKGVNILIATPGRLTDHLDNTEVLDVGTVRWLVLDEGDRLMEMGFEEDIRTIVGKIRQNGLKKETKDGITLPEDILPSRRVTVLCSATMKMNVQKLGEISLEDALHITASLGGEATAAIEAKNGDITGAENIMNGTTFAAPSQLKQTYTIVPAKLRLVTLIALLRTTFARKGSVMKAIIFISCADSVDFHFELLRSPDEVGGSAVPPAKDEKPSARAVNTASTVAQAAYITSPANRTIVLHKLHGTLAQPVRTATLASFSEEKNPAVLITTDISSRGLDVPAVDLVIEYDPAFAVADHLHRIGRTARAGRPGKAVLFLQPGSEEGYVSHLKSSSSSTPTPQLYDSVLQKGFAAPVDLPAAFTDTGEDGDGIPIEHDPSKPQSWTKRSEALQLHLEQRLLRPPASKDSVKDLERHSHKGKKEKKDNRDQMKKDSRILDAARQAFRSHIRAYATHVREERVYFDITQLHLGHTAKSFALREAPGGIGGGVQRRAKRPAGAGAMKKMGTAATYTAGNGPDDDDVYNTKAGTDEDAARRMREKMQAVMSASAEFNIG